MNPLESRISELANRVRLLEDRAAIQDLRFRYHVAVNEKALEAIPELFTEDAEVSFEGIGEASGLSEIVALYAEVVGQSPFIKQFIHNHLITLDGDAASGLSYLDARTVRDGESLLVAARFDDRYRRTTRGWRFESLRLTLYFAAPLSRGWAAPEPDGRQTDAGGC